MKDRLLFYYGRIRERLWFRPLIMCIISLAGAFLATSADGLGYDDYFPDISKDSVESLLSIIATSMLMIATFAVASMISAYASASNSATPRSFSLMISDDISQNALSTFIGAFIYSMVALTAVKNDVFQNAGLFVLFVLTLAVIVVVILIFILWTDRIARLGRVGSTINNVKLAAHNALRIRGRYPNLGGVPPSDDPSTEAIFVTRDSIGYVQRIDMDVLQEYAEVKKLHIVVHALPGTFSTPDCPLAKVFLDSGERDEIEPAVIAKAFLIGEDRIFDDDPRFGLIALSEIASRAMSPAVNDPGTAIVIIGKFIQLFSFWNSLSSESLGDPKYPRIAVPALSMEDMFDDAFTALARDGANAVEVMVRLQKAFGTLARMGDPAMRASAIRHADMAFARASHALPLPDDLALVRHAYDRVGSGYDKSA